jgi:hypothetical protein
MPNATGGERQSALCALAVAKLSYASLERAVSIRYDTIRESENPMTTPILSTIAGLTGALTLAAGSPAAAAAPPVSIVACDYSSFQGSGSLFPETAPFQTSNLQIAFVNQAPLAATDVQFAVGYDGRTQNVEDAGTFSHGTQITQNFMPSANLRYNGTATCSVQSVTFSDGSTWRSS